MDLMITDARNSRPPRDPSGPQISTLLDTVTNDLPQEIQAAIELYVLNKPIQACNIAIIVELNEWLNRSQAVNIVEKITTAINRFILSNAVSEINLHTRIINNNADNNIQP